MNVRRLIPRLLVLLVLVAAAAWTVLHRDQINLASLEAGVRSLGFWAPAAYVSLFAAATLASCPESFLHSPAARYSDLSGEASGIFSALPSAARSRSSLRAIWRAIW